MFSSRHAGEVGLKVIKCVSRIHTPMDLWDS